MPKIALVDYGVGNLHSARKALELAGAKVILTADAHLLAAADGIVLPGVGAFDAAMARLRSLELDRSLVELIGGGKPLLGICLGMQVLFSSSEEGSAPGLGAIPGRVRRFRNEPDLTIPHVGWNDLTFDQTDCALWRGLDPGSWVYFVHSFFVEPADSRDTAASAVHGSQRFTAAVARDRLWGVQFHPEKSARIGLRIIENFVSSLH